MKQNQLVAFRILYSDKLCDLHDLLSVVCNSKMYNTSLGMLPGMGDNKGMQNFGKQPLLRP